MKTCPICKKTFADELNFCLEDGGLLVESEKYESETTLVFSNQQTWQRSQETKIAKQPITNPSPSLRQTSFNQPTRKTAVLILFGIGSLMVSIVFGVYLLSNYAFKGDIGHPDKYRRTPTVTPTLTPTATPTPQPENNIKIEILEKTTDGFGTKFLKCKITNISDKIIELNYIGLNFYKGDVKISDSGSDLELKILKPNQTIPIWVNLYGTDGYTSVKVKEPNYAKSVSKPNEQLFPQLEFSETEMKAESGYMSVNFRQYKTLYYKVSGIVENQKDEKKSLKIFAIFYDANTEIVGIGSTYVVLEKGEKTKFLIQNTEKYMFGKPKTFEIIAISYP